ncbi:MAG: hypothetical protein K9N10_10685 [Deltaproteobacteria bacterium]|nr:hypothetical protein [Deltaproteobacteria bacterium]
MEVPMDEPLAKGHFGVTKGILTLRARPGPLFRVYSNRVFGYPWANTVFSATGKRIRKPHITPEDLMASG